MIVGLWHGGTGYSSSDPERDLEQFHTVGDAKAALADRYRSNGMHKVLFQYVNREPERVFVPCVEHDSEILLYRGFDPETFTTENGPDYVVKFGPRGGVVVERY